MPYAMGHRCGHGLETAMRELGRGSGPKHGWRRARHPPSAWQNSGDAYVVNFWPDG